MSKREQKKQKSFKPKARVARGFRDLGRNELALQQGMIATLARVYAQYGFDQLDTPAFEYADALGKFLPDADRPNEGVFALEDDDGQWLSLRYDLTAPLARYVAEHFDHLPKPLRRYQHGYVFRNEKPGPGRYRQFMQMDADTVGAASPAADAEICMMAADCMRALGLADGDFSVRINSRKLLDAMLKKIGLSDSDDNYESRRLTILRAMDKLDRLGMDGVRDLLGAGRKDDSGDFTKGAELPATAIDTICQFLSARQTTRQDTLAQLRDISGDVGAAGLYELEEMNAMFDLLGYDETSICFDPSIVRGLDYYTGAVFEIELTFETTDENGEIARFGSVGGGGRYDDLVKRFKGIEIPATGISIGVSRLAAALLLKGLAPQGDQPPLIVILVMDKENKADYARMVQDMRRAGLRAEMYMGDSGMKPQLRYADARGARFAIIEGEDERAKGLVTVKDLALGAEKSAEISDNAEWRSAKHAQFEVSRADLVATLQAHIDNTK